MLFGYVGIEAVRYYIKVIFAYTTNEAVGLHVFFDALKLISQLTEGVNDQT
jgi:hypothetical protein